MDNAQQGQALLQRALALPGAAAARRPDAFRAQAAQGLAPARRQGDWWQVAPPPEPQLALTAGQLRAARQQRLNAERAARDAARRPAALPAAQPARAAERQPALGTAAQPPVPWKRYGAQMASMALLALLLHSFWFFVLGVIWVSRSLKKQDLGWPRFWKGAAGIFVAIILIGALLPR
jgi:hypothetical protein